MSNRRIVLALLSALSISTVSLAPRESQAGLLVGALAGQPVAGAAIGFVVGAGGGAIAKLLVCAASEGCYAGESGTVWDTILGWPTILGMTLLDVDAMADEGMIAQAYQIAYPDVESVEAIDGLARATKEKIAAAVAADPSVMSVTVRFNAEELGAIFGATSVPSERVAEIARDLR